MFRRISTSWQLVKASAAVLRSDTALIIYPIVSTIGTLLVTAAFFLPLWTTGFFSRFSTSQRQVDPVEIAIAFLFYLVQYFVIIFANTALIGAAMQRLQGGQPTVGDGFRIAFARVGVIFGYALISATVGIVLQAIRDRAGWVGRIAASVLDLGWNIATYLAIPVFVVENVGPIEAIKRSGGLLKRTWGEQIVGNVGIGAVFGLLTFLVILLGIPFVVLAASAGSTAGVILTVALVVVAVLILALIGGALSGIYRAALYRYAATGQIDPGFSPALVQSAFRPKRRARVPFSS
jgi:hypothetical protein